MKQLAPGARVVRAHVVQPFERPADPTDMTDTDVGAVVDLPFNTHGALTTTIAGPTSATVGIAVQFDETGLPGAGSNQWQWQFGANEGTLPYPGSASVSYTFSTSGSKLVRVSKKDANRFVSSATRTVKVAAATAPDLIGASNVTATSAVVSWTNTMPLSTTVQFKPNGTGTWLTAGTAAAGATTFGLTNLMSCTGYDLEVYHVSSAADIVLNLFATTAPSGLHSTRFSRDRVFPER